MGCANGGSHWCALQLPLEHREAACSAALECEGFTFQAGAKPEEPRMVLLGTEISGAVL